MFKEAFSGFSVKDLNEAQKFYGEVLGLDVDSGPMGMHIKIAGTNIFVYDKADHQPATFTILNFPVDDIDQAVKDLSAKGVKFEHYDGLTDETGVARGITQKMGPDIAWFKDPAGNILAVLQEA